MSPGSESRIAVIGLGRMGLPMAQVLKAAGADPLCHDIGAEARRAAEAAGLRLAGSAADAFAASDIVLLSLPSAAAVESTVTDGLGALRAGAAPIVIDASTSTAETSRRLAVRMTEAGGAFLDAPVSGGPAGAAQGTLTFMVGGSAETLARCQPILDTLGAKTLHAGAVGAGNIAKIANNMMVAAHMVVACESLALAQAAGLAPEAALDVVNAASGGSTVTQVHIPKWVTSRSFDSGFSMALMRKDIGLAMELAGETGLSLPLSRHVSDLWNTADAPDDAADFTEMGDPDRVGSTEAGTA